MSPALALSTQPTPAARRLAADRAAIETHLESLLEPGAHASPFRKAMQYAVLGQGQLSLAKYLFIAAEQDSPPDIHDIPAFLRHVLERADWRRDLHFQTRTTIDTLDYSGEGFNRGSKVVVAATGGKRRESGPPACNLRADVTVP